MPVRACLAVGGNWSARAEYGGPRLKGRIGETGRFGEPDVHVDPGLPMPAVQVLVAERDARGNADGAATHTGKGAGTASRAT